MANYEDWAYCVNVPESKWWAIRYDYEKSESVARYGSLSKSSFKEHRKPYTDHWDVSDRIYEKCSYSKGYIQVTEEAWEGRFLKGVTPPNMDDKTPPAPAKPPEGKVGPLSFLKRKGA